MTFDPNPALCCGNHWTQSPIEAQAVNLTGGISKGEHELCIHKRTQQGTTIVFYLLFI